MLVHTCMSVSQMNVMKVKSPPKEPLLCQEKDPGAILARSIALLIPKEHHASNLSAEMLRRRPSKVPVKLAQITINLILMELNALPMTPVKPTVRS